MPFIATEHAISVVPCRLPCPSGIRTCAQRRWGYRATCSACRRFKGARRETFEQAEQDGLAHLRATGAGR
jgi:hypothetical protein